MDLLAADPLPPWLVAKYDVAAPRYTSYPPVPAWTSAVDGEVYGGALEAAGRRAPADPLSLYVHLPFCRALCTYCGCNVVVTRDPGAVDVYLDHVARELALVADRLGPRRSLSQIHWGGGTPTFLSEAQLERLWEEITRRFDVLPGAEVAIEVDPRVTTRAQIARLGALGFGRISLGVQDLDPVVQAAIGRRQSLAETRATIEAARASGFAAVNLDLVYGLPHQTPDTWARTLDEVVALAPDRLALYSFAYVPAQRPHQRRLPIAALPAGGEKLALFLQARRALLGAGFSAIGFDHFARGQDELARAEAAGTLHRNFQGYTVKAAPDVVAIGVTAISDLGDLYAQSVRTLPRYYAALDAGRLPTVRGIALTDDDRRRREVITALLCRFSVDLGEAGRARFAAELEALRDHERDGLVRMGGGRLEVTPVGRLFARNVASVFDAHLGHAPGVPLSRAV
jgi:oxygen-independent coproporphyrinogen-3 oxidase